MRLNLATSSCLLVIGCTFPIKNDRIDTAVDEEEFSDFGQVEVQDIDNCEANQLKTFVEFRTGGEIVSSLSAGQNGQVWAVIGNACKNEINFTTNSGCLFDSWLIEGGGFDPGSGSFVCDPAPVSRTLRSGQAFQRLITPLNDLPDGVYDITVNYNITNPNDGSAVSETNAIGIGDIE